MIVKKSISQLYNEILELEHEKTTYEKLISNALVSNRDHLIEGLTNEYKQVNDYLDKLRETEVMIFEENGEEGN